MTAAAKTFVILFCLLVCSGGAFVASRSDEGSKAKKPDATPVHNPNVPERIWLQA